MTDGEDFIRFEKQLTPKELAQIKAHWLSNHARPSGMLTEQSFGFKPRSHRKRWERTRRWTRFVVGMVPILVWAHIYAPNAGLIASVTLGLSVAFFSIVSPERP